jgi:hypothetical protein
LKKRFFKILLDYGHLGNGNSLEVARYVTAKNCVDAFFLGNRMPRVKRKREKTGTIRVIEISYCEYIVGLKNELAHSRFYTSKTRQCS